MSYFKKVLSLLSVFILIVLAGFTFFSEAKAQTATDTEPTNIIEQCVPEGEIASTTVSPEYRTECCDWLESMHPYDYPENYISYEGETRGRIVGAGSLCYDPSKGAPECLEENGTEEGWYYPNGDLLREFECKVQAEEMTEDEENEVEDEETEIEENETEGNREIKKEQNRKRTKILNLQQMRYYKDIIRKEDGSLYGVKKDQEIIDRINGDNRVEEERDDDEGDDDTKREKILNLSEIRYYKDIIRKEDGSLYGVKKDDDEEVESYEDKDENDQDKRVEKEREEKREQMEREIKTKEVFQERKEEIEKIKRNVDNLTKETTKNLQQKIKELQSKLEKKDEIIERQKEKMDYVAEVLRDQENLSDNIKVALSEFISKGTNDNSKKIGEGERAAVIKSYKYAFGHLPQNKEQIEDAVKISNGRFPSQTSEEAENKAKLEFEKIYNREANMENPNDSAAVNIMAYGLRQRAQNRNLNSELQGINTFATIYGHKPQNTQEWNIMQAITYSGAKK
jgi:uncharacterized protein YoxC